MKPKSRRKRPLLVGLTGGIASGKTTVAQEFEKRGAGLVEADRISREIVRPRRKAWRKIVKAFGSEILTPDGEIDRRKLGALVFASPAKRKVLERITHPEILAQIRKDVRGAKGKRIVIIDLPLLFEAGLEKTVDRTVVVWAPESVQRRRLGKRDGFMPAEIRRRLAAQMPLARKKERADYVIDNSKTRTHMRKEVEKIWGVLTNAAQ